MNIRSLYLAGMGLFVAASAYAGNGRWTVLGWNNLGMHCMDDDFSVFSILPPYNTVNVQLINASGKLVKTASGVTVTYEAVADATGSINRTSFGKTNFWTYSTKLFGPYAPVIPDKGLAGFNMPGSSNTPQPMKWMSVSQNWFEATGIPITPFDDRKVHKTYPMMRVKVLNSSKAVLARADIVLPVSDEMSCRDCHASGSNAAARPTAGWAYDSNSKRDSRLNILRLHDEDFVGTSTFTAALSKAGYLSTGLYNTAQAGTPILCAKCHQSEALSGSGQSGIRPLTQDMHSFHANVVSPTTGQMLNASTNRASCYECHPGSTTKCLRGAMGSAGMQCQDCHGSMSTVGSTARAGWLDEPNCQACHTGTATRNSGQIRYTNVFVNGSFRKPADNTFATQPDTPAVGKSLYRFSTGHGGVACEACHGSTHAEFPSSEPNDNVYSTQLQGHVGVIVECTACHATMPSTVSGGPHGMHPVGSAWVSRHEDVSKSGCQNCHGTDWRGTVLSKMQATRTLAGKTFQRGTIISCYSCHNGPSGDD